jgi:NhaA family Na+:H+ antiporter
VALGGLTSAFQDPIVLGVAAGLVLGKPIGIMAATWLTARFTHADLDEDLTWVDMLGLSVLAGIGFTVSLLIGELAFGVGQDAHVKVAVLAGSVTAALLAAVILRLRNRTYRRIHERELADRDHDGVPDVYEDDRPGMTT